MVAITKVRNLLLIISLATFAVALILQYVLIDNFRSDAQYLKDVQLNVKHALQKVDQEVKTLSDRIGRVGEFSFTNLSAKVPYPYFIFRNDSLLYWSDYQFVPNYENIKGDYTFQLTRLESGKYLTRQEKYELNGKTLEVFILLPIFQNTEIDNKYLNQGYNISLFIQEGLNIRAISEAEIDDTIISYDGNELFSLSLDPAYRDMRGHQTAKVFQTLLLILFASAILLFFFSIKVEVDLLFGQKRIGEGFALLVICLVFLRFLMLGFNFPNSILPADLFNGRFYASSIFNPSLGDLLLNALACLVVTWYLFRYYFESILYRKLMFANRFAKHIAAVVLSIASFGALYFHYYCLKTIYFNSQLTLDITKSIDFSGLKILSLGVIAINTATFFLVMHILCRTIYSLLGRRKVFIPFGIGLLITLGIDYFTSAPFYILIIINIVYVMLIYLLNMPKHLIRVSYTTFLYLFWGALASAVIAAFAISATEQITTTSNKQKFANQILIDNDVLGEFLLSEASEKIKQDMFILSRWLTPTIFSPNDIVKEKIKRVYLSRYLDKYDKDIYLFNSKGMALTKDQKIVDYQKLKDEVFKERFKTADYSNIFFINQQGSGSGNSSKRYLCFIDLVRGGSIRGHIVIDLKLKRFFPNSVYPELLIDRRYASAILGREFHYAEFNNGELTYSTGNEDALKLLKAKYDFQNSNTADEELVIDNYHFLIIKDKGNEDIVIISDAYSSNDILSNFSFLFIVFVSFILLFLAVYTGFFWIRGNSLNFSTKIQLYLNAAFFIPLLAVCITTMSIVSNTYSNEVTEEYQKKAASISGNLVESLDSYQQGEIEQENLSNSLTLAAKYTESDINLYDTDGKLIVSSQPQIYENNLLSRYINPLALANIHEQDNNLLVLDESVGSLDYKSSYIGVRSFNTGSLLGILSIPFFESQNQLEQQIIKVLTNVINIFTLIFIIFLVGSYLASYELTFPLKYITQKLKRTSLSDYNEPLSWDSDDEIGLMISEYNRMLVKLEASKEALSRSEKESAWREMAKQVAHEIKNPLTPMKLSLQHLKRVLQKAHAVVGNGEHEEGKDTTTKPIDNLLEQVDTLSEIATSFSSFAQMPIPKSEYFDLAPVVKRTVELFQDDQRTIELEMEKGSFGVESDSHLMSRIISNLIINAKQSVPQGKRPKIIVSLNRGAKGFLLLKVSDNGSGISKEIQDKVFLPNFSTKYAGSGIGLAIAKRGIEHSGGRIAFETKENTGTTFYIELPLAFNV